MKYRRRIARFLELASETRPVVFIRTIGSSYRHIIEDPRNYWFDYFPIENVSEFSFTLYEALKKLFPQVKIKLIVVKKTDRLNKIEFFDNITVCYLSDIEDHRNWEALLNRSF